MKQKICIAVNKGIKKPRKNKAKCKLQKRRKCVKIKTRKNKKTSTTVLMTAQTDSEKQNKPYREKNKFPITNFQSGEKGGVG